MGGGEEDAQGRRVLGVAEEVKERTRWWASAAISAARSVSPSGHRCLVVSCVFGVVSRLLR